MQSTKMAANLAGYPKRFSSALQPNSPEKTKEHNGFIKLRLGHSAVGSILVPDIVIGVAGKRYFTPSFFGPPVLAFNVEQNKHIADLSVDVASPTGFSAERLQIRIRSDKRIKCYDDGAQLYQCTIKGPRKIARMAAGICKETDEGDFALKVFHHTTPETVPKIRQSQEIWGSRWNLAGTRELENVAYAYFTSLNKIENEDDLNRIAMASNGELHLQTTSDRYREKTLKLTVYRESTNGRTSALPFYVPCGLVAPTHLYLHPLTNENPAYYEVIGPEILRVALKPGEHVEFDGENVYVNHEKFKRFSYVILGDASSTDGLAAPYDEEETKQVTHIEALDTDTDLFDFWLKNQNSDQVCGRVFEKKVVKPRSSNDSL